MRSMRADQLLGGRVEELVRIQQSVFNPADETERFRRQAGDIGALASFTGYVRAEDGRVDTLFLKHYPAFTEARIGDMETHARERFDVQDVLIIHRHGALVPGEPIVLVAAASAHRKDAIGAVDFLMDYLKTDAPFWKKEIGAAGERWIEPRMTDVKARASWEDKP